MSDILLYENKNNISTFYAGDSVSWFIDYKNFKPIDGYNLSIVLNHAKNTAINLVALSDIAENLFKVSITNIDSALFKDGKYNLFLILTRSSDNFTKQMKSGYLEILPNIVTSSTLDVRTHNQKVLDSINAQIENKVLDDVMNYSINGKTLTKTPYDQLMKLKNEYEGYVYRELAEQELKENGHTNKNSINWVFNGGWGSY